MGYHPKEGVSVKKKIKIQNSRPPSPQEKRPLISVRNLTNGPSLDLAVAPPHTPSYVAHKFLGKIVVKPLLAMGWEKRRIEVGMPELFSLKINHSGKWSESAYTGGFKAWFDYVYKDFMSFFEIDEMVKELGYDGFMLLIEQDQDVAEMCTYVPGVREIEPRTSKPQHLRHHNPLSHRNHALRKLHNLHLSQLKPLKPLQSLLQEVRKGGGMFHDAALML
ncbi:unnamed protein product [Malus baccata var. baccata]